MANIRDADLERYLQIHHETYLETAERLLPSNLRDQLRRLPLIEAGGLQGYISTHGVGGAAWEYTGKSPREVNMTHGSMRIEDLIFDYPKALLKSSSVFFRGGSFSLSGGTWQNGRLMELVHPAFVKINDLYIRYGRWVRPVLYAEISTDRSDEFWSDLNAVKRAKDELLVAAVDQLQLQLNRDLSLEDYVRRRKPRQVLVCGDYTSGQERLEQIKSTLHDAEYEPIRLDEIPDYPHHDLRQKFEAMAPHVRFIVIDDSSAAGQMVEVALAESGRWLTLVMRMRGTRSSYMTVGGSATSTVLREMEYAEEELAAVLRDGIAWAEARLAALGEERPSTFPWIPPPDLGAAPLGP
jgi:hypothetical protein